jgi:1,4-dihydroxy-2-naphthoate octaprenyltransferase
MWRALSALLRTTRLRTLRRLVSLAEGSAATLPAPPALLARRLQRHEDRLFAALGGAMSFQLLRAAHAVGLFRLLHQRPGLDRAAIAAALGLSPYPTEILLLGLVPLGLVAHVEGRYHNDPWLSGLLSGAADGDGLGKILTYLDQIVNPAMAHLEASVRENRPVGLSQLFGAGAQSFYGALAGDPERAACFQAAMAADTALNRDRVAASDVFAGHHRLLDVGGNIGELALAVAAHHPALRVTVLDFPAVAARARARFQAAGLAGRLDATGCDLRADAFPPGHDAVLFAHFLDIFSPAEVRRHLARAFACLPEGGAVLVFGSAMRDDERGPLTYGVLSAYFLCLADGEGRFYTARQTAEAMRAVGFVDVEKRRLPRGEILLRAFKPRADVERRLPRGEILLRAFKPRAGVRAGARARLAALVDLGRPRFLLYSLLFYGLGAAAAVRAGVAFGAASFLHGLAFVVGTHLMTHYCNDYFDLAADAENRAPTRWTGGSRVLVDGRLAPRVSLGVALALAGAAAGLAWSLPAGTRWLALAMIAAAWSYTAPPLRLNYRGLGEITVAAVLNLGVPLLGYGLQTGRLGAPALLLAVLLPAFVLQAARMLAMNLADRAGDAAAAKRTLAVVLGARRARQAIVLGQLVGYGALAALTLARVLPAPVGVAMWLTLPLATWQAGRVLAGALEDRARAGSVAFWASTHVALVGAAATLGLLAGPAPAFAAALGVVILAVLAAQIRREQSAARAAGGQELP